MPQFAANLHYLFSELPFLERFEAAAAAGFKAVEFQVPYDYPSAELSARLHANGLKMVLFDAPMGDWERTYVANLRHAASMLAGHGIAGVIEPINKKMGIVQNGPSYTTQGMHGYFLNHTDQARRILDEVGSGNLLLHLDCYHMQMLEGNLAETIREHIGLLRHVQIAGVPGRHEPSDGEINYPYLFDLLDELGYGGWVGCEYRPRVDTWLGLSWAAKYGIQGTRPAASK